MARYFTAASSEYLQRVFASPVPPLTVSLWFWPTSNSTQYIPFMICDKDSAVLVSCAVELAGLGAGQCAVYDRDAGGVNRAVASNSFTANQWNHVVGTVDPSTPRIRCYLNGDLANKGFVTSGNVSLTEDQVSIGAARDSTPSAYFNGAIAEVALWDVAFEESDPDISALAAGCSPLTIRPSSLRRYWPLVAGDTDLIGGYDLTAYNTPTWHATHPPIWTPRGGIVVPGAGAAGGTAWTKDLSDTVSLADSLAKAVGVRRTDSLSVADALGKGAAKPVADTMTLADAMAKAVGQVRSETLTITDALVKAYGLSYSDSVAIADVMAKAVAIVQSDNVAVSDAFAYVRQLWKTLADTLTISDALASELTTTLFESLLLAAGVRRDLQLASTVRPDLRLASGLRTDLTLTSTIQGGG